MNQRPNSTIQQLDDTSIHDWYRFVLAFPDHLVEELISRLGIQKHHTVLDPFVGTGTTPIECKKRGIASIGIDANPVTAFASQVKTTWDIDLGLFDRCTQQLMKHLQAALRHVVPAPNHNRQMALEELFEASDEAVVEDFGVDTILGLIPQGAISDIPLRKVLAAKQIIDAWPQDAITDLIRLALVSVTVEEMSNLGFGPEIYVKAKKKLDADLCAALERKFRKIRSDLAHVQPLCDVGHTSVFCGDARNLAEFVPSQSVDFVITSPPYPNEKDYSRITRLEMVLLGFISDRDQLQQIKKTMLRSHTRNIYKGDQEWRLIADVPEICDLAETIEQTRLERGATSGFERLYHKVVTEYFGGMYRVLEHLQNSVRSGGKVALVVGDQMSFFQVPIRTAHLLSIIAQRKLAFREVETLVWRTRLATATKREIEEHILILERE